MEFNAKVKLDLVEVAEYIKRLDSSSFNQLCSIVEQRHCDTNRPIINPFLEAAYNGMDCEVNYSLHNLEFDYRVLVEHTGRMYTRSGEPIYNRNSWQVYVLIYLECPLYNLLRNKLDDYTGKSLTQLMGTEDSIDFLDWTSNYIKFAVNRRIEPYEQNSDTLPFNIRVYMQSIYDSVAKACDSIEESKRQEAENDFN